MVCVFFFDFYYKNSSMTLQHALTQSSLHRFEYSSLSRSREAGSGVFKFRSREELQYYRCGTLFSFQFFLLVKNKIQRSLHSPVRVQGITTLQVVFFNRRDCPLSSSVYQLNFKRSFFRVCIILIQYLGNFLTITVSR